MAQQTAVEWLLQQIENKNDKEFSSYYQEFVEQAKAMEKEQIIKAWDRGYVVGGVNGSNDWVNECDLTDNGEYYYNETYKKNQI